MSPRYEGVVPASVARTLVVAARRLRGGTQQERSELERTK
jgi:hypothetical protein